MQQWTQLFDRLVAGIRPGAVGEQGHGEAALGIAPERSPGVAEMAEGARGKSGTGLGWFGGRIPPEGSRSSLRLSCRAVKSSTVSGRKIGGLRARCSGRSGPGRGIAEQSGVPGNPAHGAGVLVVDLALDDAAAIGRVVSRWGTSGRLDGCGINLKLRFMGAKVHAGKRHPAAHRQCAPVTREDDESNIAVLAAPWRGLDRNAPRRRQHRLASVGVR